MLELARRALLAACLLIGLWLFFLPDASPLWTVRLLHGFTDAPQQVVSGPVWEAYAAKAVQVLEGGAAEKGWMRRLVTADGPQGQERVLYYKYYEPPLAELGPPRPLALSLDGAAPALRIGVFVPDPARALWPETPPASLTHPWRKTGWKAWVAGLIAAAFLPWPARGAGVLCLARRKVLALDAAWLAFTAVAFGGPLWAFDGMAWAGAGRAAVTLGCWGLAGAGLGCAWIVARKAGYRVVLQDAGLLAGQPGEEARVSLGDISLAQQAQCQAPFGLGWLLRAVGWRLTLADGSVVCVWLYGEDQAAQVAALFEKAGIPIGQSVLRLHWLAQFAG